MSDASAAISEHERWILGELMKAEERGIAKGLGIDAAASLTALAKDGDEARRLLIAVLEDWRPESHESGEQQAEARAFLATPRAALVMKETP